MIFTFLNISDLYIIWYPFNNSNFLYVIYKIDKLDFQKKEKTFRLTFKSNAWFCISNLHYFDCPISFHDWLISFAYWTKQWINLFYFEIDLFCLNEFFKSELCFQIWIMFSNLNEFSKSEWIFQIWMNFPNLNYVLNYI